MKYQDWIVDRLKGQEVCIVASGPSLKDFDYSTLHGKNVITTNHAYKKLPHLWCVAVDYGFIQHEDPRAPYNTILLSRRQAPHPIIEFETSKSFSMNPSKGVYTGKCSGVAAITTALHAGASVIYLYGFDLKLGQSGESHSTEGEFKHRRTLKDKILSDPKAADRMAKKLANKVKLHDQIPPEKIINMNPSSAIKRYKVVDGY